MTRTGAAIIVLSLMLASCAMQQTEQAVEQTPSDKRVKRTYLVSFIDVVEGDRARKLEQRDQLMELVQNTAGRPEDWAFYGGASTIESDILNGNILLTAVTDEATHADIAQRLNDLRKGFHPPTYASAAPTQPRDAGLLEHTVVSPHLEALIEPGVNVLWCATAQFAWNEFTALVGEDVQLEGDPPAARVLSKRSVTRDDIDDASCVATAGLVEDGVLERIRALIVAKFGDRVRPRLLDAAAPARGWLTYALLYKELPFATPFDRQHEPLEFGDEKVWAFGIEPIVEPGSDQARQILVLDYVSDDDFIIELTTTSPGDRLILAKIAPGATLDATITAVQSRIKGVEPTSVRQLDILRVPIIDFDLMAQFEELSSRRLHNVRARFAGESTLVALQTIRFRLDEHGAELESEVRWPGLLVPEPRHFEFDKPFLVLLQRTDRDMPYFAVWLGNTELMKAKVVAEP